MRMVQPLLGAAEREGAGGNKIFQVHPQEMELETRYSSQRGKRVCERVFGVHNRVLEDSRFLNHWKLGVQPSFYSVSLLSYASQS